MCKQEIAVRLNEEASDSTSARLSAARVLYLASTFTLIATSAQVSTRK